MVPPESGGDEKRRVLGDRMAAVKSGARRPVAAGCALRKIPEALSTTQQARSSYEGLGQSFPSGRAECIHNVSAHVNLWKI